MTQRSRGFCFTNFDEKLDEDHVAIKGCDYCIQGKEVCPDTGKEHWQSYVYFKNARTWNSMKKKFGGIHVEVAKGSPLHNFKYCSKDDDFIEFGTRPKGEGHRSDLDRVADMVSKGASDREVALEAPTSFIRFHRGIRELRRVMNCKKDVLEKPNEWKMPEVRIYWGESRTGKTKAVYDEFGMDDVYPKPPNKWWDLYNGETCILVDDFDPEHCHDIVFDKWLKLLDGYPEIVEFKGLSGWVQPDIVIFTSNFDPESWFPFRENRDAFFKRVTEIKNFRK